MKEKSKIVLTAAISVVVTAVLTANATSYVTSRYGAILPLGKNSLTDKIGTINSFLDSMYLYDYDEEEMTESAVSSYVEAIGEPYTHYYTKAEFDEYNNVLRNEYTGIGVVVSVSENNEIEVVSTIDKSPAFNAGIKPRDILTEVDGVSYTGEQLTEAVTAIKSGKAGETVELTLKRESETIKLTVERSDIRMDSVSGEMLDDTMALVRISAFDAPSETDGRDTSTEFKEVIERLKGEGMKKLILDLRDNPGGSLDAACNIADMLLGEGTITYMEYKDGSRKTFTSDADVLGIPMVVLINANSASASEVLTGALKDYSVATIIGTKSYGKGIVQSVFPLSDGSGMSMTIAKYYSPSGVCIHGVGVEPDINVDMPGEFREYYASTVPRDKDTQLQRAVLELSD